MKKLFFINLIFLLIFLLIWIFEILSCINYDSVLIDNNSTIIIAILLCTSLIVYISYNKFRIGYIGLICLFIISGITLLIFKDNILFYLPIYHNERFVIRECIIIYYSILSFILSVVSGFVTVIHSFNYSKNWSFVDNRIRFKKEIH